MRVLLPLLLLLASFAAFAGHVPAGRATNGLVEVRVLDRETGERLALNWHRGQAWVAGTPGHRYAVELRNSTGRRLLAVLSVDGVNAVTGETAAGDQAGYVLAPWGRTEVSGWRKNLSEVAAFEFTALGDSYAARTGRPGNVGVIGVAVFEERRRWIPERDEIARAPERRSDRGARALPEAAEADAQSGPAAPSADALAGRESSKALGNGWRGRGEPLGTGHGEREWSSARHTHFERASARPAEIVAIRYDSLANLVAAGIVERPWPRYGYRDPRPFPGGFVPDP